MLIECGGGDGGGGSFIAEAQHAVMLLGAHLLHQADIGPILLIVADGADAVNEILLLALHIGGDKHAVFQRGSEEQLAQQLRHRLKELLATGGVAVINERGHKAHALALPLLADGVVNLRAVESIEGGGEGFHIGIFRRAAAQHRRQQGVQRGRLLSKRRDEMGAQKPSLKFLCRKVGQKHTGHKFTSVLHWGSSSV